MDNETLKMLEKGRELYDRGKFEKAKIYLLKVSQSNKNFADVMNMLGVIHHDEGATEEAKKFFEQAVEINPRYTEAMLNLAVSYNEQGMYPEAKDVYKKIVTQKENDKREIEPFAKGKLANMHGELARIYAEMEIRDEALEQYKKALKLCPAFIDIRTRYAQTLKDDGKVLDSIIELEKIKEEKPDYLQARIMLGVSYFSVGENDKAKEEWKYVLQTDPENRTAGMYLRMVNQIIAQKEAAESGIPLEVSEPISTLPEDSQELFITIDGKKTELLSAAKDEDKS